MTRYAEIHEQPGLENPVVVLALEGWIDAGLGAARALEQILEGTDAVTVATFDTDVLLDHRARRPTMRLEDGLVTELRWPSITIDAVSDPAGADVLLVRGAEPDHMWGAFAGDVVDVALTFGARMVCGLGAYPAPVPHTRGTGVVATATSRELASEVGFVPGRIDVPSGVHAAIEQRAAQHGVPAVGLWAQVPHYAAAMPYPAAALALLDTLERVGGVAFDRGPLAEEAAATRERIDGLVAGNPEHEAMVAQLEAAQAAVQEPGFLISGDELAAELEQFLRDEDS
ncbi:MAG: PAC2 family protein [Acidimicrobiia bacterium]|nr:PAC2 family protein [Acidimicrobiia bacterium]